MTISYKHLTVVFTINDQEKFKAEQDRLHAMFKQSDGEPYAITAISVTHELRRLDLIEQAVSSDIKDRDLRSVIDFINGIINVEEYQTLNDVLEVLN